MAAKREWSRPKAIRRAKSTVWDPQKMDRLTTWMTSPARHKSPPAAAGHGADQAPWGDVPVLARYAAGSEKEAESLRSSAGPGFLFANETEVAVRADARPVVEAGNAG